MAETRIFIADTLALEDPELFRQSLALCSRARRERIGRFRLESDKRLSLAAELLLKQALFEYGGFEADTEKLAFGPQGKPYLPDCPFYFNLSHSGERVACAVGSVELGVDLEKKRVRGKDYTRIARHFFAPQEIKALERAESEEARQELFYRFWTLKESVLKATGAGLSVPLSEVVFELDGPARLVRSPFPEGLRVREFDTVEGYALSLCEQIGPEPLQAF